MLPLTGSLVRRHICCDRNVSDKLYHTDHLGGVSPEHDLDLKKTRRDPVDQQWVISALKLAVETTVYLYLTASINMSSHL